MLDNSKFINAKKLKISRNNTAFCARVQLIEMVQMHAV